MESGILTFIAQQHALLCSSVRRYQTRRTGISALLPEQTVSHKNISGYMEIKVDDSDFFFEPPVLCSKSLSGFRLWGWGEFAGEGAL